MKITLRLSLVIASFVVLMCGAIVGIYVFFGQSTQRKMIDIAGQNRMLSQKTAYLAERYAQGDNVGQELAEAARRLGATLDYMENGGAENGEYAGLEPVPGDAMPALLQAKESWNAYKAHLDALIKAKGQNEESLAYIEEHAEGMLNQLDALSATLLEDAEEQEESRNLYLLCLFIASLTVGAGGLFTLKKFFIVPVTEIKSDLENLATGNLSISEGAHSTDELGATKESIRQLTAQLQSAAGFAEDIGQGKFDEHFTPAGDDDNLGQALVRMSRQLKDVSLEEKRRNWATEGLARFVELLREEGSDMSKLCETILSHLVRYLEANQGGIFIVNDDNENDEYLELMAMYAWDRKKFITKRIDRGEGLVGQAWLEGDIVYMTEVPEEYINITSGLGESNPSSIMIVPLKLNDEIFGLLEIASFKQYEVYQREFVQKLAESIASTLSSAKVNDRTRKLLHQSQQQAEEMRAQEEEMRQNMEELQATQENMERKEREHLAEIDRLEAQHEDNVAKFKRLSIVADNTDSSVIITDEKGLIEFVNPGFTRLTGYSLEDIIGKKPGDVLQGEDTDPAAVARMSERIKRQEGFYEEVYNYKKDGTGYWVSLNVNPVFENGRLTNFVSIQADMTPSKKAAVDFDCQLKAIDKSTLVVEFKTDGTLLNCNENFQKLTGYEKQELVGAHHRSLVPDEELAKNYEQMWPSLASGKTLDGVFPRKHKDGTLVWLRAVYAPIVDFRGVPYKVVKYAQDVTAQINQQEEIRQTLSQAVDAVISIDDQKIITYVNPAAERMFGYKVEELMGQNVKMIVPMEHRAQHDGYVESSMNNGENKVVGKARELEMAHRDGTRFWGLLSLSKIDIGGKISYTAFIKNIHEQKMLEVKVQRQVEEMSATEEEMRQAMEEVAATQEEVERVAKVYEQVLMQAVDAVISIDHNKHVTFYNTAAETMFGYTREEVMGQNIKMIVPMTHRSQHDQYVDSNITTGKNKVVGKGRKIQAEHKDGSTFDALLTLSKVETSAGVHYTAFIKNLSSETLDTSEVKANVSRKS